MWVFGGITLVFETFPSFFGANSLPFVNNFLPDTISFRYFSLQLTARELYLHMLHALELKFEKHGSNRYNND